jgi:capsular exopolysaccharide synthesis family protein
MYQAGGSIVVIAANNPQASNGFTQSANNVTSTDAALMVQRPNLTQVIKDLKLQESVEALSSRVSAVAQPTTALIDVTAWDANPTRAAAIANTVMNDFVSEVTKTNQARIQQAGAALEGQITDTSRALADQEATQAQQEAARHDTTVVAQQIRSSEALLAQLTTEFSSFQAQQAQIFDTLSVASPASPPGIPSSPQKLSNAILGALVGLLIGVGIAALYEYFDQGLRNPDDIREKLDLPTLAVIPVFSAVREADSQRQAARRSQMAGEAYRRLRTSILFSALDTRMQSILITSTRIGEGKTRTAAHLAEVLAAAGQQVLLVDCDMRRPGQHLIFDRPLPNGLSELLLSTARDQPIALNGHLHTDVPTLSLLTAGSLPPNPAELLAAKHTPGVLRMLEQRFDVLVLDSPPVGVVTDALSLSSATSVTVLVIEAGKTSAREAGEAIAALRGVGANVVGAVLNKARKRDMGDGYYGYYTYKATAHGAPDDSHANQPRPGTSWLPVGGQPSTGAAPPPPSRVSPGIREVTANQERDGGVVNRTGNP